MLDKICKQCNKSFKVIASREVTAKFCSMSCKSNWLWASGTMSKTSILKIIKLCAYCNKEFSSFPSHKAKHCSRVCYVSWAKQHRRCPNCGKKRCKEHNKQKTARWRIKADKKELKARSIQIAYRSATNRQQSISLDTVRLLINNPPTCPYCKQLIPWQNISIDHKIPISRGGSDDPSNLTWVDLSCNMMKGNLLDSEFVELLAFLENRPEMLKLLKTRLKSSGFMYRRLT